MPLNCSECYEDLRSPYFALISAYNKHNVVEEGPGLGICRGHLEIKLGELKERYQRHHLSGLSEGLVFLLDVVESTSNPDGTIDVSTETWRQGIIGYLVHEEMKKYLPQTLGCLNSRLRELGVITTPKL